jgi:hypothetical protein
MSLSKGHFMALLLVFLVGGLAGLAGGGYLGANYGMGYVINTVMDRDARAIRSMVGALRDLQGGERQHAIDAIQGLVNDQIIAMDPEQPYPGVDEATQARVTEAFKDYAEYRKTYPRASPLATDQMVESALSNRSE